MITDNEAHLIRDKVLRREAAKYDRKLNRRLKSLNRKLARSLGDPVGTSYPWKPQPETDYSGKPVAPSRFLLNLDHGIQITVVSKIEYPVSPLELPLATHLWTWQVRNVVTAESSEELGRPFTCRQLRREYSRLVGIPFIERLC